MRNWNYNLSVHVQSLVHRKEQNPFPLHTLHWHSSKERWSFLQGSNTSEMKHNIRCQNYMVKQQNTHNAAILNSIIITVISYTIRNAHRRLQLFYNFVFILPKWPNGMAALTYSFIRYANMLYIFPNNVHFLLNFQLLIVEKYCNTKKKKKIMKYYTNTNIFL